MGEGSFPHTSVAVFDWDLGTHVLYYLHLLHQISLPEKCLRDGSADSTTPARVFIMLCHTWIAPDRHLFVSLPPKSTGRHRRGSRLR